MPHYFFHLIHSGDVLLDPEGVHMSSDAVAGAALLQARDIIAHDVKDGRLDLQYRIDVHNEAGEVVYTLAFSEALEIIQPR